MAETREVRGQNNPPTIAEWTGSAMPTRKQCADLISTSAVFLLQVKVGTVFCAKSRQGRIAVLTITSTSDNFNTGEKAQATVWDEISAD